jgi:hypothetical protein
VPEHGGFALTVGAFPDDLTLEDLRELIAESLSGPEVFIQGQWRPVS